MIDVLAVPESPWTAGEPVALATVVSTSDSSPRLPGASLLVTGSGEVIGSISGGCIEAAVYEVATEVLASGVPALERYGIATEDSFTVGLTCGGTIDVFVRRVSHGSAPELLAAADDVRAGRPVAVAVVIDHESPGMIGRQLVVRPGEEYAAVHLGEIGGDPCDAAIADDVLGMLNAGRTGILEYGPAGERLGQGMRLFVQSYAPPPRMLVFGAIDFARATIRMGKFLGYHVTLCDARPLFATQARFPEADEVVVLWPHKYLAAEAEAGLLDTRTVVVVLTHDPKFDVPVLEVALRLPVGYVGAMGSRRTHEDRIRRLGEIGMGGDEVARLHSPLGHDIGARTPEETAVSIAAEIVASRWGRPGGPLMSSSGPIHADV